MTENKLEWMLINPCVISVTDHFCLLNNLTPPIITLTQQLIPSYAAGFHIQQIVLSIFDEWRTV